MTMSEHNPTRSNSRRQRGVVRRLLSYGQSDRGNIAALTAILLPILLVGMGAAIDYASASGREDKLNGIADSAALATTTPTMMANSCLVPLSASCTIVKTAAQNLFNAQASLVGGVSSVTPTITVLDTRAGAQVLRTTTVSYTAASSNVFAAVLSANSETVAGRAVAKSAQSPRVNFYLLVDTSPSMEIPGSVAGINTMVAGTGCAFACHESSLGTSDSYNWARNHGVTLRIDLVNQAVLNLMTTAPATATANNTIYKAGIYSIDYSFKSIYALNPVTFSWPAAQTAAATISPLLMCRQSQHICGQNDNDQDSDLDVGMQRMNTTMPAPGNGTTAAGDPPQEVLFIVSDGLPDTATSRSTGFYPIGGVPAGDWCTAIKARGIRIAFLYLTYNPLPSNSFYQTYVAPMQPSITPAAQSCASPGLFFQVDTGGDVTSALQRLFQQAVSTAYLSH